MNQRFCSRCKYEPVVAYTRRRRKTDPAFALNNHVGAAIRKSLIRGAKAKRSWEAIVEFSLAELIAHLERQFLPGMTWENRGQWHIDHKRPLASFKFETPDDLEFKKAWDLRNLQPLWAGDNLSKGAVYRSRSYRKAPMIKMKALRSFGVTGSNEGKVKRGREFTAKNDHRARELEHHGLAYRVEVRPPQPVKITEIVPALNKAATSGPLGSPGGMTGAEEPVPSSLQDPPRRSRRSGRSKDDDLLS